MGGWLLPHVVSPASTHPPMPPFANKLTPSDFPTAAPSLPSSHMAPAPQPPAQPPASCQLPPVSACPPLRFAVALLGSGLSKRGGGGDASAFDCSRVCSIIMMPSESDFGRKRFASRSPRKTEKGSEHRRLQSIRISPIHFIKTRLIPQGAACFHLPLNSMQASRLARRGVPDGKTI